MERKIEKVLLIANLMKPDASPLVEKIRRYFSEKGIETTLYGLNGISDPPESRDFDIALSLGGDGTVLFSARFLAGNEIPILPVNLGDFGFITEVAQDEWSSAFEKYQAGVLGVRKQIMLQVRILRDKKIVCTMIGLNDAVISSSGISKIVRLDISLSDTPLGEYRADGVIIATPTGSTAYSAAAGGPILEPEMEAMIINPICPFTLSNRPLVVSKKEKIRIFVKPNQRAEIILTLDGQNVLNLHPYDCIEVQTAKNHALIIRSDVRNFFEVLRSKLNWSGGPDA